MHEVSIGGLKPPGNHVMLSIGAIGQNVTEFNVYTVKQKWFYDPFLNAIPLECYCAYKGNLQISSYSLQSFCYDCQTVATDDKLWSYHGNHAEQVLL